MARLSYDVDEYLGKGGWEDWLEPELQEDLAGWRALANEDPYIMNVFVNSYGKILQDPSERQAALAEAGDDKLEIARVYYEFEMGCYPGD